MAEQYPQMDGLCDTACAYAARVRQFAEQRGVSFDDAMTELEERLEQVRWKVMPAGPQRQENCGTLDVPAEECRVLRLVQGIASCYGMTAQQYMESAYVDDFFSGVADGRSGTAVAISAAWRLRRRPGRSRRKTKSCRVEAAAASSYGNYRKAGSGSGCLR